MNSYLLDPWKPYYEIVWEGQTYTVLTRDFVDDPFVTRRKFMLVLPSGKKRMLNITASKEAVQDYNAAVGPGAHDGIVRQIVRDEVLEDVKAHAKAHSLPKVSPNVKLVSLDMEPPVIAGVDFAKVESEMMAHMFAQGGLPSVHYGPSPLASVAKAAKATQVMGDAFKAMALKYTMKPLNPAYFGTGAVVLDFDSLAGVSEEDVSKGLYGGAPEPQPQLTPKGLATLKKYGVALAG